MKGNRRLLACLLLVVPIGLLGASLTFAWDQAWLEVDDVTPELGTVLNLEIFTNLAQNGHKCVLLAGSTPGPTMGIPVGGNIQMLGETTVANSSAIFQLPIPKYPGLDGTVVYFAAITVDAVGSLTSVTNGVSVELIDQEDIPG